MNRKTLFFLAAFIPSVGLILMSGCSKPFGPVYPVYIPNTSTPTGSPTSAGITVAQTVTGSPTPAFDPTPVPSTATTSATPPATSTYTPTFTSDPTPVPTHTWTNTPTSDPTPVPTITSVNTPVSTPAAVVRYLVSAPSGYDSGMSVTYRLYCLDWYTTGPVTVVDTFDPGFTYNGPTPADTANGPNFTYGSNSVTMVWPNGIAFGPSSWVTFSVVDNNVTPSEYCQVRNNQATIYWNGGSFASIYGNDSVTMVCPTTPVVTSDPTPVPTNTWTNTPTSDPTPVPSISPTACSTLTPWGDTIAGSSPVSLSNGTIFQQYVLAQPSYVNAYWTSINSYSAGASMAMGIYSDSGSGYPSTYLGGTTPWQVTGTGPTGQFVAFYGTPGIHLPAGTYWLATTVMNGYVLFDSAASSSANETTVNGQILPSPFPVGLANPAPPQPSGQMEMFVWISTCP